MSGIDTTLGLRADTNQYEAQIRAAARASAPLEQSQIDLAAIGIQTSEAFERETRELAAMERQMQQSERASRALRDEKGRFVAQANKTAGGIDNVNASSRRASGGLGIMAGGLKTVGLYFAGFLAADMLGRGVGTIYELGTTAEETGSKFATVFGPAAEGLDATLADVANTMGLTQTEARGLAATVGAVVQGLDVAQDRSALYADEILRLSGDIASFSNVQGGADQVTRAITSAITGEREALKTLGIVVSEADVKQRQATLASEGHADALTKQGKVQATLALITEKAGVAVGDLERTKDSLANRTRALSAGLREQAEGFAQELVPAMSLAVDWLTETMFRTGGLEEAGKTLARQIQATVIEVLYLSDSLGMLFGSLGDATRALFNMNGATATAGAQAQATSYKVEGLHTVVDALTFVVTRAAAGILATANALFKVGAAMAYATNNAAAYGVMLNGQVNTQNNLNGLIEDTNAREEELANQRKANAWRLYNLQNQTNATAGATGDLTDRTLDLTRASGGAATQTRVQKTRLQEANEEATKLAKSLAYLDTASGKNALATEFANGKLEEQIELAEKAAELDFAIAYWATAEAVLADDLRRTNELVQERLDLAREQADLVADIDFWASAESRLFREALATNEALRERAKILEGGIGSYLSEFDSLGARDSLGGPAARVSGRRTDRADARRQAADREAERGRTSRFRDQALADVPDGPDVDAPGVDAAGRLERAWSGTLHTIEDAMGETASVGETAFGRILDAGTTVAGGLSAAFGSFANAAGSIFDAYNAAAENADGLDAERHEKMKGRAAAAFAVQKAFAIGGAIADTYKAATGAYAALAPIPVVGPVLGGIAAAAAVAAGLANVAAIRSAQPGGSGGGGGAASAPSTNAAGFNVYSAGGGSGAGPYGAGAAGGASGEGRETDRQRRRDERDREGRRPVTGVPQSSTYQTNANVAAAQSQAAADTIAKAATSLAQSADALRREGVNVTGELRGDYETLRGTLARGDSNRQEVGAARESRRTLATG